MLNWFSNSETGRRLPKSDSLPVRSPHRSVSRSVLLMSLQAGLLLQKECCRQRRRIGENGHRRAAIHRLFAFAREKYSHSRLTDAASDWEFHWRSEGSSLLRGS